MVLTILPKADAQFVIYKTFGLLKTELPLVMYGFWYGCIKYNKCTLDFNQYTQKHTHTHSKGVQNMYSMTTKIIVCYLKSQEAFHCFRLLSTAIYLYATAWILYCISVWLLFDCLYGFFFFLSLFFILWKKFTHPPNSNTATATTPVENEERKKKTVTILSHWVLCWHYIMLHIQICASIGMIMENQKFFLTINEHSSQSCLSYCLFNKNEYVIWRGPTFMTPYRH